MKYLPKEVIYKLLSKERMGMGQENKIVQEGISERGKSMYTSLEIMKIIMKMK